jgi:hypothetical protein
MSFARERETMGLLSAGNAVSAAVSIYRSHFKLYYSIALQSSLWSLLPIYGWAKCLAVASVISRLAYGEIIDNPEQLQDARRRTDPFKWRLLGATILVGLIFIGTAIAVYIGLAIIAVSIVFAIRNSLTGIVSVIAAIVAIVIFVGIIFLFLWLFSRMSLYDISMILENNKSASRSIERSFQLTKSFAKRLQSTYGIAFLLSLPVSVLLQLIASGLEYVFQNYIFIGNITSIMYLPYFGIILAINIVVGAFFVPIWQVLKALIYYDCISRKEGLDIKMRNGIQDSI